MSSYLATTPVVIQTCPRCQALILEGWAEGLRARVDPTPLNLAGEIAILLRGKLTYTLTRGGLVHRDPDRIAGTALSGPTLGAHICGYSPPPEYRAPISVPETRIEPLDEPPY